MTRPRLALLVLVAAASLGSCAAEVPHRAAGKGGQSDGRLLIVDDAGLGGLVPGAELGPGPEPSPNPPGPPPPGCGNGLLEAGEACDGNSRSCVELDAKAWAGGLARCNATCSGFQLTECTPLTPGTPPPQPQPPPAPPPPPSVTIDNAVATIVESQVIADLTTISAADYNGRYPGTAGDKKLQAFASGIFAAAGLAGAAGGSYLQPFACGSAQTANVVAVLPGTDPALKDEVVIIGAHHDHLGTTSNPGCKNLGMSSICNGADDNGTGTIAVLTVARALSKLKGQNRRTLLFLLFGGEEQGLKGSLHYVEQAPLYPLAKTVYMINLDMIGYSNGKADALGIARSTLAKGWAADAASKHGITFNPTSSAGGGSDHYHFALANVPYVFFHTGIPPCFHSTCDTIEKIHAKQYTQITQAVARFMWTISQADQSPRTDFTSATSLCSATSSWSSALFFQQNVDHKLALPCGL